MGTIISSALIVCAAALLVLQTAYRTAEINLSGVLVGLASSAGTRVDSADQTLYFGIGTAQPLGLHMSGECTSAFLILPLLVVASVLIVLRPAIARRVLLATLVGALLLIAVNQLRILGLVGLVDELGTARGYYWGHTMAGSMISVVGGAIALVMFMWIAMRKGPAERARLADARRAVHGADHR